MFSSMVMLVALAVVLWIGFVLAKSYMGLSFVKSPRATGAFFLVATLLVMSIFPRETEVLFFDRMTYGGVAAFLIAILVAGPGLYFFTDVKNRAVSFRRDPLFRHLEVFHGRMTFLISKPFDVLFQMTVAGICLALLSLTYESPALLFILFPVLFAIAHLGLIALMPLSYAAFFAGSALVGGFFIVWLLLIPGGIYYAMTLHYLWFIVIGVLARHPRD